MGFEISDETIAKTTVCPDGFICLTDEGHPFCSVESRIEGDGLWISESANEVEACPYRVGFGRGQVCTCPVRIEIYQRYGR